MKIEHSSDRQVVGDERYRDWECFKYWFRGIEQNCTWVNKVFLVVACESQVPSWLNRKNPKLRVVFHDEFIPEELLPTFNPMTIGDYFWNIKDLSDNYITFDDDFFVLNPITPGMFFVDNYPVYKDTQTTLQKFGAYWLEGSDGTFYKILNNGMDLQIKLNGDDSHWYAIDHLPAAHKKSFEKNIVCENYNLFLNANNQSKFRNKNNIFAHVFTCLYKDTMPYYKFNNYHNSSYVSIKKDTDFNKYKDYDMVCFNDTQLLSNKDFIETKEKMIDFFESKFPQKSSFEK